MHHKLEMLKPGGAIYRPGKEPLIPERWRLSGELVQRAVLLAAMAMFSLWIMHAVALNGDENSYTRGGRAVGLWLRDLFDSSSNGSVLDGVLQHGWFMPGMSVLLSPLYAILGAEVPVGLIRGYVLAINVVLLWLIAEQLCRRWGRRVELFFLVVMALSPYYVVFLSTAWADLLSMHLGLLALFWIHDRFLANEDGPSIAVGVIAGVVVAGLTYLRPLYPVYLVVIAVGILLWLLRNQLTKERVFRSGLAAVSATVVAAALLLPWTLVVSEMFGPGLPTTAREISLIAWKGDPSIVEEAQEATGTDKVFFALYRYTWQKADAEGVSYRQAARDLEKKARIERSWSETLALYRANARRFYAIDREDATGFMHRFIRLRCSDDVACIKSWGNEALGWWVTGSWWALLALGAVLFLLPIRMRSTDDAFLSFLWKASVFSLAVWPFLRYTHGRYYVGLIPLIALGLAIVAANRLKLIRTDDLRSGPRSWFAINTIGQGFAALFVLAVVALMLSGA